MSATRLMTLLVVATLTLAADTSWAPAAMEQLYLLRQAFEELH